MAKHAEKSKVAKQYLNLFYMTPNAINARAIYDSLKDSDAQVEIWEDMNVLEIDLSNGNSVDFEPIKIDFKDPSDIAFLKNRNIQTIFAVTICEQDVEQVTSYFEIIINQLEGFLCTDSDDFRPFYVGGK